MTSGPIYGGSGGHYGGGLGGVGGLGGGVGGAGGLGAGGLFSGGLTGGLGAGGFGGISGASHHDDGFTNGERALFIQYINNVWVKLFYSNINFSIIS